MNNPLVSIIIPAEGALTDTILTVVDIDKCLSRTDYSWELIVISTSGGELPTAIQAMAKTIKNLKIVISDPGESSVSAIRRSMLLAGGRIRFLVRTGKLVSLAQASNLIPYIDNGADVVVGHLVVENHPKFETRSIYEFGLNKLSNLVARFFIKGVHEPLSKFLVFKGEAAEKIFEPLKTTDQFLNMKILWSAKKLGFKIVNAPVYFS